MARHWTAVTSPDGRQQDTLFIHGNEGPFLRALDLATPLAWWVDLPGPNTASEAQYLWTLAGAPDGQRLYIVNAAFDLVTEILSGNPPSVSRSAHFAVNRPQARSLFGLIISAEAKRRLLGGTAISPDGTMLYAIGDDRLFGIDLGKLTATAHYLDGKALDSVALSPDGAWLFAVSSQERKVYRLHIASGSVAEARGAFNAVLRVEPASS